MPYETVNYLPPIKQISFIFVQTILTDHNEASLYKNMAKSSVSAGAPNERFLSNAVRMLLDAVLGYLEYF